MDRGRSLFLSCKLGIGSQFGSLTSPGSKRRLLPRMRAALPGKSLRFPRLQEPSSGPAALPAKVSSISADDGSGLCLRGHHCSPPSSSASSPRSNRSLQNLDRGFLCCRRLHSGAASTAGARSSGTSPRSFQSAASGCGASTGAASTSTTAGSGLELRDGRDVGRFQHHDLRHGSVFFPRPAQARCTERHGQGRRAGRRYARQRLRLRRTGPRFFNRCDRCANRAGGIGGLPANAYRARIRLASERLTKPSSGAVASVIMTTSDHRERALHVWMSVATDRSTAAAHARPHSAARHRTTSRCPATSGLKDLQQHRIDREHRTDFLFAGLGFRRSSASASTGGSSSSYGSDRLGWRCRGHAWLRGLRQTRRN